MIILSDLSDVLIKGMDRATDIIADDLSWSIGEMCKSKLHRSDGNLDKLMRGEIRLEDFYAGFIPVIGRSLLGQRYFDKILDKALSESIPGTFEVYQSINVSPLSFKNSLAIAGRPEIYITSDHITELIPKIKAFHPNIFELVSGEFWSCEMGKTKRDPGYFEEVLDEIGITADQAILIDDRTENIVAASKVGIKGVCFKNAYELRNELHTLGFSFSKL